MVLMDVAELVSLHDRTIHGIITVPERVNPCLVPMAPTPALSSPNIEVRELAMWMGIYVEYKRLPPQARTTLLLGQCHDPAF